VSISLAASTSAPTSGAVILMVVPAPGLLTTSPRPPSQRARRDNPIRPMPSFVCRFATAGSNPTPSSVTVMMPRPCVARRAIRMRVAAACWTALLIASTAIANSPASSQPSALGSDPVISTSSPCGTVSRT
jgi:hypothetical protein